jgi:hypothetical protein
MLNGVDAIAFLKLSMLFSTLHERTSQELIRDLELATGVRHLL